MPKPGIVAAIAVAAALTGVWAFGERLYRNDLVHAAVSSVDLKDRSCQRTSVGAGSACPSGCMARPPKDPAAASRATECRSTLWVLTCDGECAPSAGLVRFDDGGFAKSGELIVRLSGPRGDHEDTFTGMGVSLANGISGLYRYRATFSNPDDDRKYLERMKERIEAMPMVESVEYSRK